MEPSGRRRHLKKGFTTGTCAAAGAKAAALALFAALDKGAPCNAVNSVSVTLPIKTRLDIPVKSVSVSGKTATAVIVKDAGDDPDVTNGAEFVTTVEYRGENKRRVSVAVKGGVGVGVVTRPGLKVRIGRPAINPVPLSMIRRSVAEAAREFGLTPSVVVTVSAPKGAALAEKTMNPRLGIVGGISILGTTGIVEPMSLAAYRHSITCAVDVALAEGGSEAVYATGRTSERAAMTRMKLPQTAFVLTGDHMGYALRDAAGRKGLKKVTVAAQFGKLTKLAAGRFETHCADASVDFDLLASIIRKGGGTQGLVEKCLAANTARQVFFLLRDAGHDSVFRAVCRKAKANAVSIAGKSIDVRCILVGYDNDIVCGC